MSDDLRAIGAVFHPACCESVLYPVRIHATAETTRYAVACAGAVHRFYATDQAPRYAILARDHVMIAVEPRTSRAAQQKAPMDVTAALWVTSARRITNPYPLKQRDLDGSRPISHLKSSGLGKRNKRETLKIPEFAIDQQTIFSCMPPSIEHPEHAG